MGPFYDISKVTFFLKLQQKHSNRKMILFPLRYFFKKNYDPFIHFCQTFPDITLHSLNTKLLVLLFGFLFIKICPDICASYQFKLQISPTNWHKTNVAKPIHENL